MRKFSSSVMVVVVGIFFARISSVYAHCEIPCGIYGDEMRFEMWNEQLITVEKSMNEILRLSGEPTPNYNQIVRWVNNKEKHADDIREIAVQYFLTQRIKPVNPANKSAYLEYQKKLEVLHHIIVHSMKVKQTTDLENIKKLQGLFKEFHDLYFDVEAKEHLEENPHK